MAMLRDIPATLATGWRASPADMVMGALMAMPISGVLAIFLGAWTEIGASWLVLVAAAVQAVLGCYLAGWLSRRRGR